MLKFVLFFIFILSSYGSDEYCDFDVSEKLEDLSDDAINIACAEFETQNKCEEVDPPVERLTLSPEALAAALIQRDKSKERSSIIALFKKAQEEDNGLNQSVFESKLKSTIIEFVKVHQCEPALGSQNISLDADNFVPRIDYKKNSDREKVFSELMQKAKGPEVSKKFKAYQSGKNQKNFYEALSGTRKLTKSDRELSFAYCSSNLGTRSEAKTRSYPKCRGSVSKYFQDNKAILNKEADQDRMLAQKEITSCIKKFEEAGYKVTNVNIKSSANKLKNTSSNDEIKRGVGFCGFDFLGLSKARAEFARDKILPQIPGINSGVKVSIDPTGADGDGTSGPCPYDKKGNLKPEYIGAGKDQLDKYKATDIEVEFEPMNKQKHEAETAEGGKARLASDCSAFVIRCKTN